MARVSCPECAKTFKNETGLACHLEHSHQPVLGGVDENNDTSIHGEDAGIEALESRLESLELDVDALGDISTSLSGLTDLRDRVVGMEKLLKDFREALKKQQEEQRLRDQAVDHQLAKAQELGLKGAKAQNNVVVLATYLEEDLAPAVTAHCHEEITRIYPDQETLDKLPKCEYCGSPQEDGRRSCGQLKCVAKVLSISPTAYE